MKTISVIIACKNLSDPKLKECLASIEAQDYPKDKVEVLTITEGTPESAKAIGLKRATGEIICFIASDCEFDTQYTFKRVDNRLQKYHTGMYSKYYAHKVNDPILNRYFALFGFNDPVPFYLGKCDRKPYYDKRLPTFKNFHRGIPTLGDNGFFIWKDLIMKTDLEHYSHIDNCEDLRQMGWCHYEEMEEKIHHKTGDSLWQWIKKRFHYAESLNQTRRWKMISNRKDIVKVLVFVFLSLTLLEPLLISFYGYIKSGIRDKAWFLHPFICFITVFIYGALWIKVALLYVLKTVQKN
jgi:glycosyltransferase involved in cell wall biosynthesis